MLLFTNNSEHSAKAHPVVLNKIQKYVLFRVYFSQKKMNKSTLRNLTSLKKLGIILYFSPFFLFAQETSVKDRFIPYGQIRSGYFTLHRDDRDSSRKIIDELRLRALVGIRYTFTENLILSLRVAGRYSTEQEKFDFILNDYVIAGNDGILLGQTTIDDFNLEYKATDKLKFRVGRFQNSFELGGVPKKSLDRNTGVNTDINWTDGIHATYAVSHNWEWHFVTQYNSKKGSSVYFRKPLDFSDAASRISYYSIIKSVSKESWLSQRELSFSYLPRSIPLVDTTIRHKNLLSATARFAKSISVGSSAKLYLGAEWGVVSATPERKLVKTGTEGNARPFAYQVSANVLDMFSSQNIGIVYGNIDDGFLISPDLRSNNHEIEIRHQWKITKKLSMENRIRSRMDKYRLTNSKKNREDIDLYFRLTYRL
jgi:hypothetical protein